MDSGLRVKAGKRGKDLLTQGIKRSMTFHEGIVYLGLSIYYDKRGRNVSVYFELKK